MSTARQTLWLIQQRDCAYSVSQNILRLGEEWEYQSSLLQTKRQTYQDKENQATGTGDSRTRKRCCTAAKGRFRDQIDLQKLQSIRPKIEEDLGHISDELHQLELKKSN